MIYVEVDKTMVFDALMAILYLGNVCFESGENATVIGSTHHHLVTASRLLAIDVAALEHSLLFKTLDVRGEKMKVPMSDSAASDARNALCKEVYGRLFCQIVAQANISLAAGGLSTKNSDEAGGSAASTRQIASNTCIGLLDIEFIRAIMY